MDWVVCIKVKKKLAKINNSPGIICKYCKLPKWDFFVEPIISNDSQLQECGWYAITTEGIKKMLACTRWLNDKFRILAKFRLRLAFPGGIMIREIPLFARGFWELVFIINE
jgi:hypothetical protein